MATHIRVFIQTIDDAGAINEAATIFQEWPITTPLEIDIDDGFKLYMRSKSTLHTNSIPD